MRKWTAALAVLLLAGCEEFEDPSTVIDLRLLAASLEPPEVILDPTAPALPALSLTPLLVDPRGAGPASYTLRACANDPAAPSAPGAGAEAGGNYPAGGARSSVGSARCPAGSAISWTLPAATAPSGSIPVTLAPAQVEAAFKADVFPGHLGHLHGGFDLGLPITFELSATVGGQTVVAVKRLIIWPAPLSPEHHANLNPQTTEVLTYADRDPVSYEPRGPVAVLTADTPLVVKAGSKTWLQPRGAVAEPYFTTIVDRLTDETKTVAVPAETLRYSFYATAGKFDPRESASELGFGSVSGARIPTEARYEAGAAGPVRVFIVTRDDRGGASWIERAIVVE